MNGFLSDSLRRTQDSTSDHHFKCCISNPRSICLDLSLCNFSYLFISVLSVCIYVLFPQVKHFDIARVMWMSLKRSRRSLQDLMYLTDRPQPPDTFAVKPPYKYNSRHIRGPWRQLR